MDFNVTEYKRLTDRISDSSWQLTFKKLPLVKFWCSIKLSGKAMKTLLTFQTEICVRPSFPHILQQQQQKHTTTD